MNTQIKNILKQISARLSVRRTRTQIVLALLIGVSSLAAFAAPVSPSELDFSNSQFWAGPKCLSPTPGSIFLSTKKECEQPLLNAANYVMNVMQSPVGQVERVTCDVRTEGKFDDIICTVNVFGKWDKDGCGYQRADFEVKLNGPMINSTLVARTDFQYYCETPNGDYVYHGLK